MSVKSRMSFYLFLFSFYGLTLSVAPAQAQHEGRDLNALYETEADILSPGETRRLNEYEMEGLEGRAEPSPAKPGSKTALSEAEAKNLFQEMITDSVVGEEALSRYESPNPKEEAGLCFGRALYMHLRLRSEGLAETSIRKAVLIGSIDASSTERPSKAPWGFHIATMARGLNGEWWVFDSDRGELTTLREWFKFFSERSLDQRMRIFVTEASRFSHKVSSYEAEEMGLYLDPSKDPYRGYFHDLLRGFGLLDWVKEQRSFKGLPEAAVDRLPGDEPGVSAIKSCRSLF